MLYLGPHLTVLHLGRWLCESYHWSGGLLARCGLLIEAESRVQFFIYSVQLIVCQCLSGTQLGQPEFMLFHFDLEVSKWVG